MEGLGVEGEWFPGAASGFGGGIGRTGLVCGAISGAVIAGGWRYGRDKAEQDRDRLYEFSRSLVRGFEKEFGSVQCKELTGVELTDPEERLKAFESGVFTEVCPPLVEFCAVEVLRLLEE